MSDEEFCEDSNVFIATAYNKIASEYADRFRKELDGKPLDRVLLRCFAQLVINNSVSIVDLGCGTGEVVKYLDALGLNVRGIDISREMISQALHSFPNLRFDVASMCALPFDGGSVGGAISMYSIVHFPDHDLADVFKEISRILAPKSYLLVVFQTGAARNSNCSNAARIGGLHCMDGGCA